MNAISLNNQLEIPLRQVAQLLNLPSFVVVRLATRLHRVLPISLKQRLANAPLMKPKSQTELFFTLAEVQLLEDCIQAIRQGHSLAKILEGVQQQGYFLQLQSTAKKPQDKAVAFARLPAYKGKVPATAQKKAIAPVKKSVYTTPQTFPVLKKRSTPPKEWFQP